MRILHLTQTPVAQDPRVLKELEALTKLPGAELAAFGAPADGPPPTLVGNVLVRQFGLLTTKFTRLPRVVQYALVMIEINARFLASGWPMNPAIVHCHDTMVLPAGALMKALRRTRTLIYDAHELESAKGGQNRALSTATRLIERLSWAKVDALISVSPSILAWYHDNFDTDGRQTPDLCLVNTPKVPDASSTQVHVTGVREAVGVPKGAPLFVFVGALVRGRGIELMLRTFAENLPDTHVAFIGYGDMAEEVTAFAGRHSNIHLCEPVQHDHLVPFIQEASGALCLVEDISLSDYYCLPNKLFEYAFAGIPVLASRLPDIATVVQDYALGFCVDMDEDSLTHAVERCLATRATYAPRDISAFSWQNQGANLRGLYQVLGAPTPTPPAGSPAGVVANGPRSTQTPAGSRHACRSMESDQRAPRAPRPAS